MPIVSPEGLIALASGSYEWPHAGAWPDLNNQVGPYCGNPNWLRQDALVYAHVTDRNRVESLDLVTGEVTVWPAGGPNVLFAGGGVWAANGEGGYWDSHGRNPQFPNQADWSPFCVDTLTGLIGLVLDGTQHDFCVYDGATLTPVLSGPGEKLASFRDGVLTIAFQQTSYHWTPAAGLVTVGTLPIWVSDAARFSHGWYLGWYGPLSAQVIWPEWDPQHAVLVSAGVENFNAKIYRATPQDMRVSVIGASGPGELPGEQQIFTVDLAANTVDGVPWTVLDLTKVPAPPDPYRPPVFAKTTHPLAILCFDENVTDPTAPQLTGWDWRHDLPLVCVGVLSTIDKEPAWKIEAAYGLAADLGVLNYPMWDNFGWQPAQLPKQANPENTLPVVLCFLREGLSLPAATQLWRADIETLHRAGYPSVALIAQGIRGLKGDGTYKFTEQQLGDSWQAVHDLAIEQAARVVLVFAADRADGIDSAACVHLTESLPAWRGAVPDWRDCPERPEESDDMTPILPASRLVPFWEDATMFCYEGTPGRWLKINAEGVISYQSGANAPGGIESDCAYTWDGKSTKGLAPRNGMAYSIGINVAG